MTLCQIWPGGRSDKSCELNIFVIYKAFITVNGGAILTSLLGGLNVSLARVFRKVLQECRLNIRTTEK